MDFGEKLQQLRKNRGLTQEELAQVLYVSRTAVSKWESGRGHPNIDSLKQISEFFSVSIDDLLSADKLIFIAEKENRENIISLCDFMSGVVDLFSFVLIVLPLYPNRVQDFIYSVNLIGYTQISCFNLKIYWLLYVGLFVLGVIKLVSTKLKVQRVKKIITPMSVILNIFAVVFLALTREAYAVVVVFLLLAVKVLIGLKLIKSEA